MPEDISPVQIPRLTEFTGREDYSGDIFLPDNREHIFIIVSPAVIKCKETGLWGKLSLIPDYIQNFR